MARGVHRSWSFSTYETEHDDSIPNLPEIVFLPGRPDKGLVAVTRTVIDVSRELRGGPEATELARRAVDAFLLDQPIVSDRSPVVPTAGEPGPPAPESRRDGRQPEIPQRSLGARSEQPTRSVAVELVARLCTAQTWPEFERLLEDLDAVAARTGGRRAVRAALRADSLQKVTRFADRAAPDHVHRRLIDMVLGANLEDLADPEIERYVNAAVEDGSDGFVRALIRRIDESRGAGLVPPTLADLRMRRQTAGDRAQSARPARIRQRPADRRRQANVAILGVVILAMAFAVGLLVGRQGSWAEHGTPPSPTPTTTPPPPLTVLSDGVEFVVTQKVEGGWTVHLLFRRVDNQALYPQGSCDKKEQDTWICHKTVSPLPEAGYEAVFIKAKEQVNKKLDEYAKKPGQDVAGTDILEPPGDTGELFVVKIGKIG